MCFNVFFTNTCKIMIISTNNKKIDNNNNKGKISIRMNQSQLNSKTRTCDIFILLSFFFVFNNITSFSSPHPKHAWHF